MKKLSPLKAIRKNCLDCCNGSAKEVKLCPIEDCPLHQFRFGKNPNRKGIGGLGFPKEFHQKSGVESAQNSNQSNSQRALI
ncbi:MAG: hypothetical protein IIC76_15945 [Bacteroidetes bacterium]|nr:hypothetical protein [Bacteroidota bacterium]